MYYPDIACLVIDKFFFTRNFNSRLGSFPSDARTANDALQDFMKMLEMSKSAYPGPLDEDDEDFDEQPIDIVVSRKPGIPNHITT